MEGAFETAQDLPDGGSAAPAHPPAPQTAGRSRVAGDTRGEAGGDPERVELPPGVPEEALAGLGDEEPELRAEAVAGLDPSEEAELAALAQIVAADPSPLVRAEAARQLGNDESLFATMSLLGALEDPDPTVVVAAIEALEFSGKASIRPRLEPLLAHRSPAVREAAADAIEVLE